MGEVIELKGRRRRRARLKAVRQSDSPLIRALVQLNDALRAHERGEGGQP